MNSIRTLAVLVALTAAAGNVWADARGDSVAHAQTIKREQVSFPNGGIRTLMLAGAVVLLGSGILILNGVRRKWDKDAGL
jgi:hypothetical protein